MLELFKKTRPLTSPTSTSADSPSTTVRAASPRSCEMPRSLAKWFRVPSGRTPSSFSLPATAAATELTVPSPPPATTAALPSEAARLASSPSSSPLSAEWTRASAPAIRNASRTRSAVSRPSALPDDAFRTTDTSLRIHGGWCKSPARLACHPERSEGSVSLSRRRKPSVIRPGRKPLREPLLDLFRLEPERARLPLVHDGAALVDDVEPLRPPGVQRVRAVVDVVHRDRHVVGEPLHEVVRDPDPLAERRRLRVADVLRLVRIHLPLVLGVGFLDVDGEKARAIAVLPVHLLDALDRAPERRS